jgi:phage baseplate assembly protein V
VIDVVTRLLEPVRRRLDNLVARAVVSLVADGSLLQTVQLQLLEEETRDGCERFQPYGLTSVPLPGAEAVVLFVGGQRDHPLVLVVDDRRYRKHPLQAGEVALYTDEGTYFLLKRGAVHESNAPIDLVAGAVLRVAGDQVVGPRGSAVSAPTGGATIDMQARTAINAILSRLQAHGLIAS